MGRESVGLGSHISESREIGMIKVSEVGREEFVLEGERIIGKGSRKRHDGVVVIIDVQFRKSFPQKLPGEYREGYGDELGNAEASGQFYGGPDELAAFITVLKELT